jgi:2-methylcitrate dehydratase
MPEMPDETLAALADYVHAPLPLSDETRRAAATSMADALAGAFHALGHADCVRHLGPLVPGTVVPNGSRVPGREGALDPVKAAYDTGTLIRWLDYNDTWLGLEWGHPSDNLGAILALGDHLARQGTKVTVGDLLDAQVRAYEIQGVLALGTALREVGLDHTVYVRIASAGAAARLLGLDLEQTVSAISHAWVDGGPLRLYRQSPAGGPRKSWAAGDATSRGVLLALRALAGEPAHPTALSAPDWGFSEVFLKGAAVKLERPLGSYVMDNVLYKVDYPAEFFAQTAAEAACSLAPLVSGRLDTIKRIEVATTSAALRLIDRRGPLRNPADRDHCLQYVVAVALLHGTVDDTSYGDAAAADPRIDVLRSKMELSLDPRYDEAHRDPERRAVPGAVTVVFQDGSVGPVEHWYPLGHPARRSEARPRLAAKFAAALAASPLPATDQDTLIALFDDQERLERLPADRLLDLVSL